MPTMSATDLAVAATVAGQHGLITAGQAHDLGLSDREIGWRREQRVLVPLHQGVYRHAASPPTPRSRLLAAVLASGTGAVASHRSAAVLHGLKGIHRHRPEVTVPGRRLPRHDGISLHRTDLLRPIDVTTVDRVPVTALPRTLLDLGAVVPFEVLEHAAQDAMIRQIVSAVDLICVLERVGGHGRRGTAALRAVVRSSESSQRLESHLEVKLVRLIESLCVPSPVLQHEILLPGGLQARLDTAWPSLMIAIESDGRRWHSMRRDFERDLTRTRAITAAGWRLYRYGWADLHQRSAVVRAQIQAIFDSALAGRP